MVAMQFQLFALPVSVSVGPVVLHTYGFILGCAALIGWFLVQKAAARVGISSERLAPYAVVAVFGGVLGARVWHVLTDWHLYVAQPRAVFLIWQGGLSIFGGIFGGSLALLLLAFTASKRRQVGIEITQLLDLAALGLPAAQAVGRVANFVNQELYGMPTEAWWGISIDVGHRVPGYEAFSQFHPLFLYESIAMVCFSLWSWWCVQRRSLTVGQGKLALSYMLYYATIRFFLDFLRIDAQRVVMGLTANQVFLMMILVSSMVYAVKTQLARIKA